MEMAIPKSNHTRRSPFRGRWLPVWSLSLGVVLSGAILIGGNLTAALINLGVFAVFSALVPETFALGLETVYEAYLVHYGAPRLFASEEETERVLLGDYLYAHGLVRIAAAGGVEAVAAMATMPRSVFGFGVSGRGKVCAFKRGSTSGAMLKAVSAMRPDGAMRSPAISKLVA